MQRVFWKVSFAVAVSATALIWGVGTWWDRQTTLARTQEQLQATARLLEQHADRAFEAGDKVVQAMAELAATADYGAPEDEQRLHEQIRRLIAGSPQIVSAWVMNAEGYVTAENWTYPPRRGPFPDRAYFQSHRQGQLGLTIGPQGISPSAGLPRFTLSRGVLGPDQQLKGVAAVGILSSYFGDIYQEAELGPGSRLLLTTTTGINLAAWPTVSGNDAIAPPASALVAERTLARYPVRVAVVVDPETVLAPWRYRMAATGAAVLAFIASLAWLTRMGLNVAGREVDLRAGLLTANRTLEARVEERTAAMRQSEALLSQVLEHLPVGVGVVDRSGHFMLRNPELERLGLQRIPSMDGAAGERWIADDAAGGTLDRAQYPGARAMRGETVVPGIEFLHRSDDGTEAWRRVSAIPLARGRNASGTAATVVVVEDIDRLKRSEEEVAARLEELRAVYDTAPVGLCVIDRDLRFVRINRQLAEINGILAEDHIGRTIAELLPNLVGAAEATVRQVRETRRPVLNREFTGQTPAQPGVVRSWIESWAPLFDTDGEFVSVNVVVEEVTERKRAERELRDAHLRLTSVLAAAGAGTFSCELPRGAIQADAGAAALFGMPIDREGGTEVAEVNTRIHPGDLPGVRARVRQVLRGGTSYQDEYRVLLPDGSVRWIAARGTVDEERVLHGAVFDVTALKEAQEAAVENARQLRLVADAVPALIVYVGQDERYRFVNRAFCEWFGVPREQAEGHTIEEVMGQLQYGFVRPRVQSALKGATGQYEGPAAGPGGETRIMEAHYVPFIAPDGQQEGFFSFAFDNTEQRRREAELRRTTEQLRLVADTVPALIAFAGGDRRFRFVNRAFCDWFGRERDAIEGRTVREVLGERGYALLEHRIDAALRGEPVRFEGSFRSPAGVEHYFETRYIPYVDPSGTLDGLFAFSIDLTEQKRREVELRDAAGRLRLLIDELNHRVKNTLATVQSIVHQTLRRPDVAADAREAVEARLLALGRSHDLLSRETWGSVEVGELAHEALVAFGVDDTRAARFRVGGPQVRVPPNVALALGMAFHELATNAVKYGAHSSADGTVELRWHLLPEHRIGITWKETGGPLVNPPTRRGFGSRLLKQGLVHALDGPVELDYAADGLRCHIEFALPATELTNAT